MAKVVTEQQINTFVRGLVTEASPLTFPENAALDLSNVVFNRDGTISRRLGLDYETSYVLNNTGLSNTAIDSSRISTHEWEFPGGSTTISIQVVRIGKELWFFDTLSDPISGAILNGGASLSLPAITVGDVDTSVINGYFVIVSSDLDKPVLLSYDEDTDTVTQENVTIQIRDIFGVESENDLYTRPTALSYKHAYNLVNQGWSERIQTANQTAYNFYAGGGGPTVFVPIKDDNGTVITNVREVSGAFPILIEAIEATYIEQGYYPSDADIWTLGKIGDANSTDFDLYRPAVLAKNSVDFAQVPKGRFIIDAFDRGTSRVTEAAVHPTLLQFTDPDHNSTLPIDTETGRLSAVASYAGRIFYSGVVSKVLDGDARSPNYSGFVFFSQLIKSQEQFGKCYQEADPTSSEISELVDTDGGTIQIPEATRIYKIFPARQSIIVFADNGIWEIYSDTGFTANSFQLSKISSAGTRSPNTIVDANGTIIFWSKAGIVALVQEQISGRYQPQSLSISTIQSKFNEWSDITKENAVGFFDEKENHVRWLYNDSNTYSEESLTNRYTKELVLDLTLQSFYINEISDSSLGTYPYISGYVKTSGKLYANTIDPVVAEDDIVVAAADPVVVDKVTALNSAGQYKFLVITEDAGNRHITFGAYNSSRFLDWYSVDSVGSDYSSYLVTGYQLYNDWMRPKQAPYLFMYFDRTEDGFEEVGGALINTNRSSCFVQSQWDWADSVNSGKWGTPFQTYRLLRNYIPSGVADPFDYGHRVIVTKNKLRGRGKAISLKFYSEQGKDFRLHGWALVVTGNATP